MKQTKYPSQAPEYQRAWGKQYYEANRERIIARQTAKRDAKQLAKASRTPGQFCEVCGNKPAQHRLWFEHNHTTEGFRGWVCNGCNAALGHAGDNPAILLALASYLKEHGCSPTRPLIR